jgi:hypothetical protein
MKLYFGPRGQKSEKVTEFCALHLSFFLENGASFMQTARSVPDNVILSERFQFMMALYRVYTTKNFIGFVRLLKQRATRLEKLCLLDTFMNIRLDAMKSVVRVFRPSTKYAGKLSLSYFKEYFLFADESEVRSFFDALKDSSNICVDEEKVSWEGTVNLPSVPKEYHRYFTQPNSD